MGGVFERALIVFVCLSLCTFPAWASPPTFRIGHARFTFHSASVVRMEWSGSEIAASWEDRPSLVFVNRSIGGGTPVTRQETPHGVIILSTTELSLSFNLVCAKLHGGLRSPECINVSLSDGTLWYPSENGNLTGKGNLGGSMPTMDCYVGPDSCREVYVNRTLPGLLSRDGWVVVEDSATPLWVNVSSSSGSANMDPISGDAWLAERSSRDRWTPEDTDWMFFGHGDRYKEAMGDFVSIAGRPMLMPLAAYGVWWSRYWPYSEEAITEVIDGYATRQLPLDVLVLDMDWHIETPDPDGEPADSPLLNCNAGWGGYLWNRSLFADPASFQQKVHDRGLKFVVNTHDQCGVQRTQGSLFEAVKKDMGLDPSFTDTVECHFEDQKYAKSLWKNAMRSEENEGVDYWWTDLCDLGTPGQGAANTSNYRCIADGTRGALWSNILHAEGSGRGRTRRGLVLSIDGGLGSHRYPQVGSGDTYANWTTLDFEVQFVASAANVAVAWTFDLGGFMVDDGASTGGTNTEINRRMRDPEMFLRWLQFGAVSPLFRTHCAFCEMRPWLYPNFDALAPVYRLRGELVPYIYTAAAAAHRTGVLPVHPVYYEYPRHEDAYIFSGQYFFGSSLLAAPISTPSDGWRFGDWDATRVSTKDIWLPPGRWVEWSSGHIMEAGVSGARLMSRPYALTEIPLFARGGAVLPLRRHTHDSRAASGACPDPLVLRVVSAQAGTRTTSEMYEDAGEGLGYTRGAYRITRFIHSAAADHSSAELQVIPRAAGDGYPKEPRVRNYEVIVRCGHSVEMTVSCNLPKRIRFNGTSLPQWPHPPSGTMPAAARGWWLEVESGGADTLYTVRRAVVRLNAVAQTSSWRLKFEYVAAVE